MTPRRGILAALLGGLFLASGAMGLVDELVWFRLLFLRLGGTGLCVATVTAAFMTGLGGGAWLFSRGSVARWHPVRVYGLLEIFIGIYALAVPWLIDVAATLSSLVLGPEAGGGTARPLRFILVGLTLVPATMAMGGTLPVLARLVESWQRRPGTFVGLLYGLNTLGAVIGAGAAGFFLLPTYGLSNTLRAAAVGSMGLGLIALLVRWGPARAVGGGTPVEPPGAVNAVPAPVAAVVAYAASGFIAFTLQVAWTRILALVFGSSAYAFALILVVFLAGLGLGGVAGAAVGDWVGSPRRALAWCFLLLGGVILLGQGLYGRLPGLYLDQLMVSGGRPAIGGAAWLAAAIMVPATLLLGAGFPLVVRLATGDRRTGTAYQVGALYAGNTVGAVLGAFLAALVLIPQLTLPGAVAVAAGGALVAAAGLALHRSVPGPSADRWLVPVVAVVGSLIWWVATPGWNRTVMSMSVAFWSADIQQGDVDVRQALADLAAGRLTTLLYYRDGVTETVAVHEEPVAADGSRNRFITAGGKVDASSVGDMATQVMSGQLPLLLGGSGPVPARGEDVLIIGLASGVTAGSVLTQPVASLVVVEIEEAMREAYERFRSVNGHPLDDRRTTLLIDDARAYLARTRHRFDVIISEPSSAWLSGPAKLFTREAFMLMRSRLKPGGVLCQWLQTYDLDDEAVMMLLRTLRSVFPEVAVFRSDVPSDLLLLASDEPIRWNPHRLEQAWQVPTIRRDLLRASIPGPCSVMDLLVAEPAAVAGAVPPGPWNTDDNASIEFRGPRTMGQNAGRSVLTRLTAASAGAAGMLAPQMGLSPDDLRALAVSCARQGAVDAGASLAARRLRDGPDADARWVLGNQRRLHNDRAAALAHYTRALAIDPAHAPSLMARASTLQALGRDGEALRAWEKARQVLGDTPLVLMGVGQVRLAGGDPEAALADLTRAAQMPARPPEPIEVDIARALSALGRAHEARPWLEVYVAGLDATSERSAGGVAARERLGRLLLAGPGDARRGRALLDRAAALRSGIVPSLIRGAADLLSGDGEAAARVYVDGLCARDPALRKALLAATSGPRQHREPALMRVLEGDPRAGPDTLFN
ncbi:MAG: fused MFS/spermidine synthase [Acidobacteriota bacterium]